MPSPRDEAGASRGQPPGLISPLKALSAPKKRFPEQEPGADPGAGEPVIQQLRRVPPHPGRTPQKLLRF
ncbi:MAG: hypothetical protein ACLPYB_12790 [Desulfobaccales bacterium]